MPYNINPACPSGQKTNITWQYLGQPQRSTDLGDDYDVKLTVPSNVARVTLGISADFTYYAFPGYEHEIGYPQNPPTKGDSADRIKIFPGIVTVDSFTKIVDSRGRIVAYDLYYTQYSISTGTSNRSARVRFVTNSGAVFFTSMSNLRVAVASPTNGSSLINHEIQIFKSNQIVLTDTGNPSPTVTYRCGESCPPNTCEVDCGSYVCCYGSDGISVFNYNK